MERTEVLARVREKRLLVTPDALEHLCEHANAGEIIDKLAADDVPVVTKEKLDEVAGGLVEAQKTHQAVMLQPSGFRASAKDVEADIKFHPETDVTGKSTCTGKVEDFVEYFRDRFAKESRLLKGRPSENGIVPLSAIDPTARRNVRVVGMVMDKRVTKNGHTLIEIEDEATTQPCLISRDAPLALKEMANEIVPDEVLAFDGYGFNDLFIVKNVVWPDVPIRDKKLIKEDVCIAMLSDLQVGSRHFLREPFTQFLRFLNGETGTDAERELAGKIKYVTIAGDVVDGIGIYPEQEKELATKDIYTQYEIFSDLMEDIPDHIHIIVSPGNHDAVRIAQPRPRLPVEFTRGLEARGNVHFVGDPSLVELHGLKLLMCHGDSFFSMSSAMPKLREAHLHPEKVGVELLKKRHLSPVYGENPLVPEHTDFLYLTEIPDVMQFGHVHRNGNTAYRGTTIVNSGTWQDVTDYQVKQGHIPTPCQLPIYNCRTGNVTTMRFK